MTYTTTRRLAAALSAALLFAALSTSAHAQDFDPAAPYHMCDVHILDADIIFGSADALDLCTAFADQYPHISSVENVDTASPVAVCTVVRDVASHAFITVNDDSDSTLTSGTALLLCRDLERNPRFHVVYLN